MTGLFGEASVETSKLWTPVPLSLRDAISWASYIPLRLRYFRLLFFDCYFRNPSCLVLFTASLSIQPSTQRRKGENRNRGPWPMTRVPTLIPEASRPRADATGRQSFYFYFQIIRNGTIKLFDDFILFPLT